MLERTCVFQVPDWVAWALAGYLGFIVLALVVGTLVMFYAARKL